MNLLRTFYDYLSPTESARVATRRRLGLPRERGAELGAWMLALSLPSAMVLVALGLLAVRG